MVRELGARLGGVWKSLCRLNHHGGILFDDHDVAVQGAGSSAGVAKGSDQVVSAQARSAVKEGASLRIAGVKKHFPAPDNPHVLTQALEGVTLNVAPGELVS